MRERLEEIKEETGIVNGVAFVDLEHLEWLIQQAERMEQYEKTKHRYKEINQNLRVSGGKSRQEAMRYRQALEDILTTKDFESVTEYLDRITRKASEVLKGESE